MSRVAFVFTSPHHHLEMMVPVADTLARRGISSTMISLAELRGFKTPADARYRRAIPFELRKHSAGATTTGETSRKRGLVQQLVWHLALAPRLRPMLAGADVVVVPNDTAYPYTPLLAGLTRRRVRSVLMQEGIRFIPASAYNGQPYGSGKATVVCAWGEGSRDYFRAVNAPEHAIVLTGAPRLDAVDSREWGVRGDALLAKHGLAERPVAFLSNPIETQGFGSAADKLALFARFLAGAAPVLGPRRIPVVVKNHPHEDPRDYQRVAAASPIAGLVTVLESLPIFTVLAAARAAVVLTSTVGLEALMFDVPLGVLEIPGHEFVFDYVQRGAAVPVRERSIAADLEKLVDGQASRRAAIDDYLAYHLHARGTARDRVADVVEAQLNHRGRSRV